MQGDQSVVPAEIFIVYVLSAFFRYESVTFAHGLFDCF